MITPARIVFAVAVLCAASYLVLLAVGADPSPGLLGLAASGWASGYLVAGGPSDDAEPIPTPATTSATPIRAVPAAAAALAPGPLRVFEARCERSAAAYARGERTLDRHAADVDRWLADLDRTGGC